MLQYQQSHYLWPERDNLGEGVRPVKKLTNVIVEKLVPALMSFHRVSR